VSPSSRRIADLESDREVMIGYMRVKMREEDWHGVMDAAADLREIDVELAVRRAVAAEEGAGDAEGFRQGSGR
jgi:hypothetical protein